MRMLLYSCRILGGAFVLSLALSAQTFTTLFNFSSQDYGASNPSGALIVGSQGELYGSSAQGGRWNDGTVYELLPPASAGGQWTEVVLHSFNEPLGGSNPGPVAGPNGSLYGVSGSSAFRLDPPTGTSSQWLYTVIYDSPIGGGVPPVGYGRSLYDATYCEGTRSGDWGCGIVYGLTAPAAAGGAWTYAPLYTFAGGPQGTGASGTLAVGAGGTLFDVTENGGYVGGFCGELAGCGTVFSLTPPAEAGGPWNEAILHAFNPGAGDGNRPSAGLVIGPGGVLYGTTVAGGPGFASCGGGTAFSLTPPAVSGGPMTETILHEFGVSEGDGCQPSTPLVLGPGGVLYGTTSTSTGSSHLGTLFELTPPASVGGSWTETILHTFNGTDGDNPIGITVGPNGTLYGIAGGGANGVGTVFAVTP